MNQLMRDLGFTSYYVTSDDHAWNAVKLGGKWYFANGGYVYECTGSELRKVVRKDIPTDEYRCAAVMQGNLYFTGSDGMYKFDDAMEKYSKTKEYNITQMFAREGMLYINTEIGWRTISRKNAEKPQYEEEDDNTGGNGQTQTEDLSAPLFAAVNKSKKSIYVKLADTNYISGNTFEIQCSTKKGFSKGVQTKTTKSKSAVLKGLKKGKTYYVRVRVMKKSGTGTLCSSWAKTEKVKISR